MGLFKKFVNQTRKPEGLLGKLMLRTMNSGHALMADWGMSLLDIDEPHEIAELGCGGGRNIHELLKKYSSSKVTAIDYSPLSVERSRKYNRKMIESGRCTVEQGDVSKLELEAGKFDLATAFETIYFWPGLEKCFAEVARILKPGGYFMIVNESDGKDAPSLKFEKIIDGMKTYTPEIIEAALKSAGLSVVKSEHHGSMPWIMILSQKPAIQQ